MEAARGARSGASAAAAVLIAVMIVGGLDVGGAGAEIRLQKNVQVSLRAKWAGTPLLLEACELLSKEWKNLFWDFIEHWKELEKGPECLTAKCCVQKIVEDARSPELCPTYRAFSLPQEWLWCESWCGNATKARAKTIDLCNNPMTKESKLQGARRIVPEWVDLDSEARQFTAQILGENPESAEVIPSPSDASKPDDKGVDQNLKDEL